MPARWIVGNQEQLGTHHHLQTVRRAITGRDRNTRVANCHGTCAAAAESETDSRPLEFATGETNWLLVATAALKIAVGAVSRSGLRRRVRAEFIFHAGSRIGSPIG